MGKALENMTDTELIRLLVKTEVEAQLEEREKARASEQDAAKQDPFAKRMEKYGKRG